MNNPRHPSDIARIKELEAAFVLFNQASDQLSATYSALEEKVAKLTAELELLRQERESHIQALERNKRLVSMGEMAASLAHQVRTPLATALLYASHLTRKDLPEPARDKAVDKILTRLTHLDGLVNDMLRFARGEHASSRMFDLTAWFESAQQVCQPLIEAAHAQADWLFTLQQPLSVMGDRDALITLVQNLVQNAIQAHQMAELATPLSLRILVSQSAQDWFLNVIDNGPGMREEIRERVFEPFFTTHARGTGLGLAVVAGIVEAHHGELELLTAPQQGCQFEMKFPISV
jgi:two-component system sensor histidine kinase FlrB